MTLDKDTQVKVQSLQFYEQNYQSLLMQKQAFQLESNETENALKEISESKGEIYKVFGRIMVQSDRSNLEKDLLKRKELINLRLKSIEKQAEELSKSIEKLRKEIFAHLDETKK